ncbi:S9 family peptidase [Candidatus Poriferisodalis sp.]|uniref:S9 family peptidase n=1 Tax=Candidatus Poriferisodalis sp. TaxID=3101277 RepID=UPI003B028F20
MTQAPVAPQRPHVRRIHGTETDDPWHWLRDRDDPAVRGYLEAENVYAEAATAHLADLREQIFGEIKARTKETHQSLPTPKDDWEYRARTVEGLQYVIHVRRPRGGTDDDETVLLDENELAEGHEYFAVGDLAVSPDHRLLAYTTDTDGDEKYTLTVVDIATGQVLDGPDVPAPTCGLSELSYGLVWANDNSTLFAVRTDDAQRPNRVIRHVVSTDPAGDVEVYRDDDERFWVGVGATSSERFVVIGSQSKITSEHRLVDADRPDAEPLVARARTEGIEYGVDHQGERLLIVTNDGALDFRLVEAPVPSASDVPATGESPDTDDEPARSDTPGEGNTWRELIGAREGIRIDGLDCFQDFVVVHERQHGLVRLRVHDTRDAQPSGLSPNGAGVGTSGTGTDGRGDANPGELGPAFEIEMPEPVYEAGGGANAEFDTRRYRFGYTSMVTPPSIFELDLDSGERELLDQLPVLGDVDLSAYTTERISATAPDGTAVPISLVWKPGEISWPAPCLLYGYGAYEIGMPASFSTVRLSLLDRGVLFAIAHVRGGGELGRAWYEGGKLASKHNTFDDFAACAAHLASKRWADPQRICARGGSAGGLLMGAMVNRHPELFCGIVAEVPFVDVLNTMLDPAIPLTVTEYDEWGDPNDPVAFETIRSYAPYENVEAADHPALLVTAGLTDPRVQYWEPAKWVAKLRETTTSTKPILLRTEMGAGHGGPSGRYDAWRDEAFILAFICDVLGVA